MDGGVRDAQEFVKQNVEKLNVWRDLLVEETAQVVALETKTGQVWRATKDLAEELGQS